MAASDTMRLHEMTAEMVLDEQAEPDDAPSEPGAAPEPDEPAHAEAAQAVQHIERTHAVHDHVVKVECSRVTLFAFLLDDDQRFISFDEKPRMLTYDDAVEIQGRLPMGVGQPPVSIEKIDPREM